MHMQDFQNNKSFSKKCSYDFQTAKVYQPKIAMAIVVVLVPTLLSTLLLPIAMAIVVVLVPTPLSTLLLPIAMAHSGCTGSYSPEYTTTPYCYGHSGCTSSYTPEYTTTTYCYGHSGCTRSYTPKYTSTPYIGWTPIPKRWMAKLLKPKLISQLKLMLTAYSVPK